MNIDAKLVGMPLKPYQTTIGWRQTTNYAAAVQDDNPAYFDNRGGNCLVAHPMFPVAVTWPILNSLDRFVDSADFPKEVLLTQVHYSEHLVLHRLVQPGDKLSITGQLQALLPHRAGTHAIICLDAEGTGGEPVFTEYIGAMLRGVDCGQGGQSDQLPSVPRNSEENSTLWKATVPINSWQPYVYDGCSDIEFPIHTSPKFAEAVGLPGIILQGTATLAIAVREMVDREASQNPENIFEIACKYTGMVLPGTTIEVCCMDKKQYEDHTDVFFNVCNRDNKKAIRDGYVRIKRDKLKLQEPAEPIVNKLRDHS